MKNCLYCGAPIVDIRERKRSRKDKVFCSQACHDKQKYINATPAQRGFKETFGLNYYAFKGLKRKLELIEMFGGKCEICGYDKNIAAFDFHHKNPDDKKFEIKIQQLNYKGEDEILDEIVKCMLLCSNCHRELHNPYTDIKHVNRVLDILENQKLEKQKVKRAL